MHVTFAEGSAAAWMHDQLKPHVTRLVVCNPRRDALLKVGNKSDRIDAQKLAELLRGNQLQPVYHGEHGLRTLKELVRSYLYAAGPGLHLLDGFGVYQHLTKFVLHFTSKSMTDEPKR